MTYDSKHIKILPPKEWYDLVHEKYWEYHSHLDWFDKFAFSRFLPRWKKNIRLIDLGAWDWRLYKFFRDLDISKYVACDISESLLKKHPWKVEKVVCDLETTLPFSDSSFDLAVSFFVIEHLSDIKMFFDEAYRILDHGWSLILGYFLQRRSFVWKIGKDSFKIRLYNHRVEDIIEYGEKSGFIVNNIPLQEKWSLIWYIFVLEK